MKIIISSKNMELSDNLRDLFEKKAGKLERYLKPDTEMLATFSKEGSREMIEITIPLDGALLRAEESGYDIYAGIDEALERVERQIHKYRARLGRRLNEDAFDFSEPLYGSAIDDEEEDGIKIVRTKRFSIKPMDAYEAVEQMEMLGHNFFVYQDAETGSVNVVYKRKDGNYGLIEPELD